MGASLALSGKPESDFPDTVGDGIGAGAVPVAAGQDVEWILLP